MYRLNSVLNIYSIIDKSWMPFFILAVVVLLFLGLICLFEQGNFFYNIKKHWPKGVTIYFGLCAFMLAVFAFIAPNFFVGSWYAWDLESSERLSSTVNGLMNPFIALSAAILTFMAFWVQYNANQNIHNENKKQQAERQFYEMLKIHRDNVEKIEFVYFGSENEAKYSPFIKNGDLLFPVYEKRFDLIHAKGQCAIQYYLTELKTIYECLPKGSKEKLKKAYDVFFNGLDNCTYCSVDDIGALKEIKKLINSRDLVIDKKIIMPRSSIMNGNKTILNPYYRHLYLTVKSIVNSNFDEPEKKNYLNILRASLTAEEQALLFFNWYYGKIRGKRGYGYKWEYEDKKKKKEQKFLSKWGMIHNIVKKDFVFTEEFRSYEGLKKELETDIDIEVLFEEC